MQELRRVITQWWLRLVALWGAILRWLAAPVFADEEKTRRAGLMNVILLTVTGFWLLALILQMIIGALDWGSRLFALAMIASMLGIREGLRRGWIVRVAFGSCLLGWLGLTIHLYSIGTTGSAVTFTYIIIVAVAALTMNTTVGLLFFLLSVAAVWVLKQAELAGLLPPVAQQPQMQGTIDFAFLGIAILWLMWVDRWNMLRALARSRREVTRRRAAEEEARRLNAVLDQRVAERTAELEQATGALRASEEKFRTFIDFAYDWEYWLDPSGGPLYVSPSCQVITGYPPEVFLSDPDLLNRIIHPADRQMFHEHLRLITTLQQPCDEMDFRIVTRDGKERWIGHVCQPVYSANGTYRGVRGSNRDITDRKIMEAALRESEIRFHDLFDHSPVAYLSLDAQGCFMYANANLCELLGYSLEELRGRSFREFWSEGMRPRFAEHLEQFKRHGLTKADLRLLRRDGSEMIVMLEGRIQYNLTGQFERTHCVLFNVTERQRLQDQLSWQNEALAAMHQSSLDFLRYHDLGELFRALIQQAMRLLDAPFCELMTVEGDCLEVQASSENQRRLAHERVSREEARLSWLAVETREPVVLEDYAAWPLHRTVYGDQMPHAVADFPMLSGERCLGVLALGRSQPDQPFRPEQVQVGQLFAQVAALAIENAQLTQELREQSIRDPLTGLHNRRYLFETIGRELARAARENYPVSIVLIDVDRFKDVNDSFGHGAGDAALVSLADHLRKMVREGDIVCRYAGDEHILVLYNTTPAVAAERANHLRAAVQRMRVMYEGQSIAFTISMGIATFPLHGQTVDQVISAADRALYRSKNEGRNRVTVGEKRILPL